MFMIFSNDDEVEAYTASMNMDAITENLTNAGMPEGWLDDVIAADSDIESAETDGVAESEEQTDMAGDKLDDSGDTGSKSVICASGRDNYLEPQIQQGRRSNLSAT